MFEVTVEEHAGLARDCEPVRFGIPLARGVLPEGQTVHVVDDLGRVRTHQAAILARWSDRSVKWLSLDVCLSVGARAATRLRVRSGRAAPDDGSTTLRHTTSAQAVDVEAADVRFAVPRAGTSIVEARPSDGRPSAAGQRVAVELSDVAGRQYTGLVESATLEDAGPVRTSVRIQGRFPGSKRLTPLTFDVLMTFLGGTNTVEMALTVTNTRAARHAAGLWDLGDRGSCRFRELAVVLKTGEVSSGCRWYADPDSECFEHDLPRWCIYQDSSGGENWNSRNHLDASGTPTVRFRGYRACGAASEDPLQQGLRAQPAVSVSLGDAHAAAAVRWFWQNFPTSIATAPGEVRVGLFPRESGIVYELQGGERKRQTLWLDLGRGDDGLSRMRRLQHGLRVRPDAAMCAQSKAVPYLGPMADSACSDYVRTIVDGPGSFVENREKIDEYGWRNFGDLYADHEAVNAPDGEPLISHYNNQYDFVFAAGLHFLRTGDTRWYRLMEEAALHTMDIDMYHTEEDRAAYNGGMFWHTDHYRDAATATHRTYSRANYSGPAYGGGPSNEHNYTSGLLLYHYLSGDPAARRAVLTLADWVVAMDDGSRTPLAILDARPTGLASRTVSSDYHKPGRGAGNSINALLDALAVSGNRSYLTKAEELLTRCIHPEDDVAALGLDSPEHRWSYLVFLQVLGKYLDVKEELGEIDWFFHYARASLLRYADWMLENEVPYKDVLHKVELPTETWPAQDIRKCHVMHLAAWHCGDERRLAFSGKAALFYDRCLRDLLGFETAGLTRPRVILAAWGHVHDYFASAEYGDRGAHPYPLSHNHSFGDPQEFRSQRDRLAEAAISRCRSVASELRRQLRDTAGRLRLRFATSRRNGPS